MKKQLIITLLLLTNSAAVCSENSKPPIQSKQNDTASFGFVAIGSVLCTLKALTSYALKTCIENSPCIEERFPENITGMTTNTDICTDALGHYDNAINATIAMFTVGTCAKAFIDYRHKKLEKSAKKTNMN